MGFVALCVCLSLLLSCHNDNLSTDHASNIIKDTYDFPVPKTELFQYGEILYSRHFGGSKMSEHKYLFELGLITFDNKGVKKDDMFMYDIYDLSLTAKGNEYKTGETTTPDGRRFYVMKAADVKFNSVTEVHPSSDTSDTSMKVEFTWSYTDITPFGVASNLRIKDINELCGVTNYEDEYGEDRIFNESVVFVKDEGEWRMQGPLNLRSGLIKVEGG